ncbi:D-alanyl-D-alanine carboxypeptidase/D-alanyl-D-alanine endopeptidase [Oceanobacillus manasiensis]|uniref:D-alanyl-D-alanine carboxypeptidase/D-alanyl-D-alanine endopeptidase n=1 Tax=Oceanobacillus manasiensis TaxID=586413 RepID=UPI0005A8CFAE|nr:D-alanyl-D-alanine carboxypeptidase/D-alanyl-D-alanine-endopeptidase [Oceanobacillus manasiensis]
MMLTRNVSRVWMLLLIFCLVASVPIDKKVHAIEERGTMKQRLDSIIETEPMLNGALVGMSVRDAKSGKLLYGKHGDTRLRPASNMKLLTAAAALEILGEDYTFPTEIKTDGVQRVEQLEGNLYLVGKGDPTLTPEDFAGFAERLQNLGITHVEGDLIGDDTWYDNARLSPDLIWSDESFHYGAQISALTASPDQDYDAGSVTLHITPSTEPGEKPLVTVSPDTNYVTIHNRAETSPNDMEEDLTVEREHGSNEITLTGTVPAGAETVKEYMAVWDPTSYAMALFQDALQAKGITWSGEVKIGKAPEKGSLLIQNKSIPIKELLVPFMKLSNNVHGEVLVKEMGKHVNKEGSWEKGLEVMEEELEKLGLNQSTLLIRDGSGISHVNLIPANELSKLLFIVQDKPWFPAFKNALPVAGETEKMVGGTLRNRLGDVQVEAKTGTIFGVTTLSGYLQTLSGENYIFSIMINNVLDEEVAKEVEDRLVRIMVKIP